MLARLIILFAFSLFLFTVGVGTIHAANLVVNPVRVTLSESQKTGAITVLNKSTEPVSIQLEVLSWSQEEGKDVLTPTREILATPPIFTIPAGASQLIRIGLRRVPEMQREQTYRVILQELPAPPSPEFNGTRMMMRISLPVFVLPKLATKPVLLWKAIRTLDGGLKLVLPTMAMPIYKLLTSVCHSPVVHSLGKPKRLLNTFYLVKAVIGSCQPSCKTQL